MNHKDMCTGPDLAESKKYAELSKKYELMSKFYTLEIRDQLVFMAMFNQMVENNNSLRKKR